MEVNVRVRPATFDDAETIALFNCAMSLETEGRELDPAVVRQGVRNLLLEPSHGRYVLAELGRRVVGQLLITFEYSDWRDGVFWWIQSVYVEPQSRGRGVYRALHKHVEASARSNPQVCGLRLYVDRENTLAQRVYQRLGMVPTRYEMYEVDWSAVLPTGPRPQPPCS